MAKLLRDLLDAEEPLFSLSLKQLEADSGHPAVDTRLVGDILNLAYESMRQLGLDHTDTTGRELYHALLSRVEQDDKRLTQRIGAKPGATIEELLPLLKRTAEQADIPRTCWALKRSVARDLLRACPPPTIMKRLGHHSVDSMLKHESLPEVYGALRFAESPEWLRTFNESYKNLTPSDFEQRDIEIVIMPAARWGDVAAPFIHKKRHNITHLKELGVVLMLPVRGEKLRGITLWALALLFHYINEIRLYSSFFKLQQVKKNFGEIFVQTLNADPDLGPIMAGQRVHWRVIQRYFGKLENERHPEIFEPHVQPEDLHWRKAEEVLYKLDPDLAIWHGRDFVGLMYDGRPVSFNITDVAASYSNQTPYEDRTVYHFRESLWNEIFMRYMGQKNLERQVLVQLDNEMIAPEDM